MGISIPRGVFGCHKQGDVWLWVSVLVLPVVLPHGMRNGGEWDTGEQFGKEVNAGLGLGLDGGCSNFEDQMGIHDQAG